MARGSQDVIDPSEILYGQTQPRTANHASSFPGTYLRSHLYIHSPEDPEHSSRWCELTEANALYHAPLVGSELRVKITPELVEELTRFQITRVQELPPRVFTRLHELYQQDKPLVAPVASVHSRAAISSVDTDADLEAMLAGDFVMLDLSSFTDSSKQCQIRLHPDQCGLPEVSGHTNYKWLDRSFGNLPEPLEPGAEVNLIPERAHTTVTLKLSDQLFEAAREDEYMKKHLRRWRTMYKKGKDSVDGIFFGCDQTREVLLMDGSSRWACTPQTNLQIQLGEMDEGYANIPAKFVTLPWTNSWVSETGKERGWA